MGEWKEYKLGELISINAKSIDRNYPYRQIDYLDTGSITRGKIESFQSIDLQHAPSRAKRLVKNNDIIYSTVRPIQRHHGIVKNPKPNLVVSTGFAVLSCDEKETDAKYIYYFLTSDEIVNYLDMVAEGSTSAYPSLTPDVIADIDILLPPLLEQKSIASILSSLDDKIDLLHRQNKTLEALAETLFRQWFVEEAEGDKVKLGDVVKTSSGGTPSRSKSAYYSNGTIKWVKSKELQGSFIFETEEKVTDEAVKKSSAKLFPANTTLIAMYGATVGEYGILAEPATCNQAICALIPNENYPYTFLFILTKFNKENLINMACGSAQQNISQELIQELEIPKSKEKIKEFHRETESMFQKIKSNTNQIRTLTRLRDTLLPKLMSGEVRIHHAGHSVKDDR